MKLITRFLYLSAAGIMLLTSCAKEQTESYDKFENQALAALSMLGFARAPAEKVLRGVLRESPAAPVEELIRMALKKL